MEPLRLESDRGPHSVDLCSVTNNRADAAATLNDCPVAIVAGFRLADASRTAIRRRGGQHDSSMKVLLRAYMLPLAPTGRCNSRASGTLISISSPSRSLGGRQRGHLEIFEEPSI